MVLLNSGLGRVSQRASNFLFYFLPSLNVVLCALTQFDLVQNNKVYRKLRYTIMAEY